MLVSLFLGFDADIVSDDPVDLGNRHSKSLSIPRRELRHLMAAALQGDRSSYARFLAGAAEYLDDHYKGILVGSERETIIELALHGIHAQRATCNPNLPVRPWILAIAEYRRKGRMRACRNDLG